MGKSYIINTLYRWSLCNLRSLEMTLLISHTMFHPVICFLFFRALRRRGRSPACTRLADLNRSWKTWEKNHPSLATVVVVGLQLKGGCAQQPPLKVNRERAQPPLHGSLAGAVGCRSPSAPLGWHEWDASRCLASSAGFQAQHQLSEMPSKAFGQTTGGLRRC